MRKKKTFKNPDFKYTKIDNSLFRNSPNFDINEMYERAFDELGLQQSKRDQLITIYLAAFAFIFPPLLTAESINWIIAKFKALICGFIIFGTGSPTICPIDI